MENTETKKFNFKEFILNNALIIIIAALIVGIIMGLLQKSWHR
ncbi:hypothetical protein HMPREF3200_00855, partial [Anaerococcus tetradius]